MDFKKYFSLDCVCLLSIQYMLKICDRIDHALYVDTTCWFRRDGFLLFIWLSAIFLYVDGKTVGSRCKRLRKAFGDPVLELHLPFYTATLFLHIITCFYKVNVMSKS